MSDQYLQFCTILTLTSEEEESWWKEQLRVANEMNKHFEGGVLTGKPLTEQGRIYQKVLDDGSETYDFCWGLSAPDLVFEDEENGSPYHVAVLVHAFFKAMRPNGHDRFEITWAETCSSMVDGAFLGGAMVATKKGVGTASISDQIDLCMASITDPFEAPTKPPQA